MDLDATASQGDAGQQGGTGSVLRIGSDPDALGRLSLAAREPISQSFQDELCCKTLKQGQQR